MYFTLAEGAFINRLHYSIGYDQVHRLAVSDHKRFAAEFIDHTDSSVGCIEDCFRSTFSNDDDRSFPLFNGLLLCPFSGGDEKMADQYELKQVRVYLKEAASLYSNQEITSSKLK